MISATIATSTNGVRKWAISSYIGIGSKIFQINPAPFSTMQTRISEITHLRGTFGSSRSQHGFHSAYSPGSQYLLTFQPTNTPAMSVTATVDGEGTMVAVEVV